jgi:hypothetical protein
MKQITNFSELQEGKKYNIHNLQFDCTNEAVLISKDFTGMNRDIVYFQFIRYTRPISKAEMIKNFEANKITYELFALWDFEMKYNEITET